MPRRYTNSALARDRLPPPKELGVAHHASARFFFLKWESVQGSTTQVRLNDNHLAWLHNGNGGSTTEVQRLLQPTNLLEIRTIHRPERKKRLGRLQLFGAQELSWETVKTKFRFLDLPISSSDPANGLAISFDVSSDALPPSTFGDVCQAGALLSTDDLAELESLLKRTRELYRGGNERAWTEMYAWDDKHHAACRYGNTEFGIEAKYLVEPDFELAPTLRFELALGGRLVEVSGENGFEKQLTLMRPSGEGYNFRFARTRGGWMPLRG